MGKVVIITDSTSCLPKELAEEYGIHVAPIEIIFEGRIYRDEVDITPAEVYAILPQLKRLPITSPPTPGAYLKIFEKVAIDTLRYLVKSRRVPQAAAWAASLFNIKPIVQVLPLSGEASLAARIRTRPKAIDHLLTIVRERAGTNPLHTIVMHANALEEAENLRERISSEFDCVESYIKDFTPVMGIQTGPGVLGIAFYADSKIQ